MNELIFNIKAFEGPLKTEVQIETEVIQIYPEMFKSFVEELLSRREYSNLKK